MPHAASKVGTFSSSHSLAYCCSNREIHIWDIIFPKAQLLSVPFGRLASPRLVIDLTLVSGRSIHRDPEVYPDPDSFKPERFLDENGNEKNTEESKTMGHHLYGFGRRYGTLLLILWLSALTHIDRRLCPGAIMADHAVWLFAVHNLWGLNIDRALDGNGNEIIPNVDPLSFTSGGEASWVFPFVWYKQ